MKMKNKSKEENFLLKSKSFARAVILRWVYLVIDVKIR